MCACVHTHALHSLCKTSALAGSFPACCRPRFLPTSKSTPWLHAWQWSVSNECSCVLHICSKGDKSILVKSLAEFPFFKLSFTYSLLCGLQTSVYTWSFPSVAGTSCSCLFSTLCLRRARDCWTTSLWATSSFNWCPELHQRLWAPHSRSAGGPCGALPYSGKILQV